MSEIHAMVDCETLGLTADAVVLSVAVCTFNPYHCNKVDDLLVEQTESWNLDIAAQLLDGRVVDPDTQEWWKQQEPEARNRAFGSAVVGTGYLLDALHSFSVHRWWSRGYMDFLWLQSLGFEPHFRSIRDSRTLLDDHVDLLPTPPELIQHVAEHDAAWEAVQVQRFYSGVRFGDG